MNKLQKGINKWFSNNFSYLQREVSNNIAKDGMSEYSEELLSVCVESFLTRTPEQQEQMLQDGKIPNFILRCCSFQIKSSTSPFYRESRRFKMSVREQKDIPEVADESHLLEDRDDYQCMMRAIEELNWYHRVILTEKWFNKLSYQQLREKYGITLQSLRNDLSLAYEIIRKKCKC